MERLAAVHAGVLASAASASQHPDPATAAESQLAPAVARVVAPRTPPTLVNQPKQGSPPYNGSPKARDKTRDASSSSPSHAGSQAGTAVPLSRPPLGPSGQPGSRRQSLQLTLDRLSPQQRAAANTAASSGGVQLQGQPGPPPPPLVSAFAQSAPLSRGDSLAASQQLAGGAGMPSSSSAPQADLAPLLSNAHLVLHRYSEGHSVLSQLSQLSPPATEVSTTPGGPAQAPDGAQGPLQQQQQPQQLAQLQHPGAHKLPHAQYVDRETLQELVSPTDVQMALCAAAAYGPAEGTNAELQRLSEMFGIPTGGLSVFCASEDGAVGLGMLTLTAPPVDLGGGRQAAAAIFAFRGTVLSKRSNMVADLAVWRNANRDLYFAARAIKHCRLQMAELRARFPHVQWGFFTTGHSLGGFTAACCAIFFRDILRVTTFESPGLTTFYHKLAAQVASPEAWRRRIHNYLSVPNPINTCQKHLGAMLRVRDHVDREPPGPGYMLRCLAGTALRVVNICLAAKLMLRCARTWAPGVLWVARLARIPMLQFTPRDASAVRTEMLLQPAAVLGGLLGALRGTGAFMAAQMGLSVREIVTQHSLYRMMTCFDPATGAPRNCVRMASWPRAGQLHRTLPALLAGALLESFVPTKSAIGLTSLYNRQAMVEARVKNMPGYVEAADEERRARPGARLRRWASDVLGMRPQLSTRESDEDTDELLSRADLESEAGEPSEDDSGGLSEASTSGPEAERWGQRLRTPFAEAAGPRVEEDESAQVKAAQRACRLQLKRALTAAALHPEAGTGGGVDEGGAALLARAEERVQAREARLERLMTALPMVGEGEEADDLQRAPSLVRLGSRLARAPRRLLRRRAPGDSIDSLDGLDVGECTMMQVRPAEREGRDGSRWTKAL